MLLSLSVAFVSGLGGIPIGARYLSIAGLHALIHDLELWCCLAWSAQSVPNIAISILSWLVYCAVVRCVGLSAIFERMWFEVVFVVFHHFVLR